MTEDGNPKDSAQEDPASKAREPAEEAPQPKPVIDVLHVDDHLVVSSKPGALLVHRGKAANDRYFLLQELSAKLDRILYPVHRLDRAASGAIAMAFSSEIARDLQKSLSADDAIKEYIVLVRGETELSGEIDRPLTDHKNGVKKNAFTSFERIATFSRCSLLRVRIKTGRHRQIRRHLAHLAHQVIGCTHHGKGRINQFFRDEYGLPRLFLHARRLNIDHPREDGRLDVIAPLAPDLRAFLERLPDVDKDLIESL